MQEPEPVHELHSGMFFVAVRPHWFRHSVVAPVPSLNSLSAAGQFLLRSEAKAMLPQLFVLLGLLLAPARAAGLVSRQHILATKGTCPGYNQYPCMVRTGLD